MFREGSGYFCFGRSLLPRVFMNDWYQSEVPEVF